MATLHFVEPEPVDEPEAEEAEDVTDVDLDAIESADDKPATAPASVSSGVVAMGATEDDVVTIDPEQLNLF